MQRRFPDNSAAKTNYRSIISYYTAAGFSIISGILLQAILSPVSLPARIAIRQLRFFNAIQSNLIRIAYRVDIPFQM